MNLLPRPPLTRADRAYLIGILWAARVVFSPLLVVFAVTCLLAAALGEITKGLRDALKTVSELHSAIRCMARRDDP